MTPQSAEARAGVPIPDGAAIGTKTQGGRGNYFARLRFRLTVGMISAFVIPILLLSFYFHFQFRNSLAESGKLHLAALAESQRNTIDLFLQERVFNILGLFHNPDFSLTPSALQAQVYLQNLRQASDAFVDLGFLDQHGVQTAYAGPFPRLQGRDYSSEEWFVHLIGRQQDYYISDIYLGFRNRPHFTIAVKQIIDGHPMVVRATLDPDKFYLFIRSISREKGEESYIVNAEGIYQVVDPDRGAPLQQCPYPLPSTIGAGVEEKTLEGEDVLMAFTGLRETQWILVVREPLNIAYARMYRARTIVVVATALIILLLAAVIWVVVRRLVRQAETTTKAKEELRYQLIHASKLASLGELAAGVAHEINVPLQIISAEAGLIRDYYDPELMPTPSTDKIIAELEQIDIAVFRARNITRKLLGFARTHTPHLTSTKIHKLLDDVVGALKEREFALSNIKLIRDYDLTAPELMVDRDEMGQVFLNLINNAEDAIKAAGNGGTITLSTRTDHDRVRIAVIDTGTGMVPEQMERIFLPFYTTKEVGKGTGLGLSVSLSIVESVGGTIEVQSVPGSGSSFTVCLPIPTSAGSLDSGEVQAHGAVSRDRSAGAA